MEHKTYNRVADGKTKFQIVLPAKLLAAAQQQADEDGISVSELARQGIANRVRIDILQAHDVP